MTIQSTLNPIGSLLLRTLAMPSDTNAAGQIFGGWIMAQLDLAGGILAKEISNGKIVTVSVSSIEFKQPVSVGDVVCVYGDCTKIGRSSMNIELEVWVKPVLDQGIGDRYKVCGGTFNYVAVDESGKPRTIKK
ncbi:acyl-CoA thioester hydrolase YciA [uncultured Vibrio sp.]|uniref:acyl-CoA thioester hydrolase YciA n=1 Tax=uncultured Vibrio sp. TaxID=114054 RepID=UPI00262B2F2F|nr:acyl-CoA thioester hydrolase YciA [uncultured Vibrio sp.]